MAIAVNPGEKISPYRLILLASQVQLTHLPKEIMEQFWLGIVCCKDVVLYPYMFPNQQEAVTSIAFQMAELQKHHNPTKIALRTAATLVRTVSFKNFSL